MSIMIVIMNLGAATENPCWFLPWEEKKETGLWMASITIDTEIDTEMQYAQITNNWKFSIINVKEENCDQ